VLETERKAGEELKNKSRELAGKSHSALFARAFSFLFVYTDSLLGFLENSVIVLKVNTKKHLDELVKERDSWKTNCIKI